MPNPSGGVAVDIRDRWFTPPGAEPVRTGYTAAINGVALPCPVAAYEVADGDNGPTVVLSIPADRVRVSAVPAPTSAAGRGASTWGGDDTSDPREAIPGWAEANGRG